MGSLSEAEAQARRHGLIAYGDYLIAGETGVIAYPDPAGDMRVASGDTMLGYTTRCLVLLGSETTVAVDLVMLRDVEFVQDHQPYVEIVYLLDSWAGVGMLVWTPSGKTNARAFADSLIGAVKRRRDECDPKTVEAIAAWGDELDRREAEMERLAGEPVPRTLRAERVLRVKLHTLAFEKAHVRDQPIRVEDASLCALDDGRLALITEKGFLACFELTAITYMCVPDLKSASDGVWEIGYATPFGERCLIFSAPGPALLPGQVSWSADEFFNAAHIDLAAYRLGASWRSTPIG